MRAERSSQAHGFVYAFVKEAKAEDVSPEELVELDELARLLSQDPGVDGPVAFYLDSEYLKIATLDADVYSFPAKRRTSDRHSHRQAGVARQRRFRRVHASEP